MRFLYVFAVLSPMLVPLEPLIAFRILAKKKAFFGYVMSINYFCMLNHNNDKQVI